jgi:hypothetical protein
MERKDTRKAPAYRIIPLNVAYSACEESQNTQTSRYRLSPLKAFPLSKFDCINTSRLLEESRRGEIEFPMHLVGLSEVKMDNRAMRPV